MAQQIAKPYDPYAPGGEQGPIPVRTPQSDGETPPNVVAPTPAPPRRQPSDTDAPANSAPAGTGPTVFEQIYDPEGTAGTPGPQMAPFIPTPVATPPPVPMNPDPIYPPDLTGRQVGDSWTEDWFDGYTRRFSIPEGNGLNTVDIVIVDAEGKVVTTARVAKAAEGPGYLRWQSDARGNSTYFETPDPAQGGYGQHFGAGVSTSGAPTAEFQVGPDWATVVTPSYDADGNLVGYDVGTRNEQGLYDNEHTDSLGNRILTTTGRDAQGRLTSEFVGQLGPDGRGWLLDEHGLPAEHFLDGNGKPVVISTDPTTRHRTVLFDGGRNVFDSEDNLIGQFVVGSDGRVLSGWSKHAWYSVERTEFHRDLFGRLREEIVDPVSGVRGRIRYLGDHTEVSYNDGSVVIFDRDGRIVDTRGFGEKALAAARNFGRGAKNNALAMLEGIGALSGFNNQFNTTAGWLGYEPNLATQAEAGEGFALGIGSMLVADISAIAETGWGAYESLTGQQSWYETWNSAWHAALNSYNEKSKLFIGTDWSGFTDNPAETLGSATVGIAAFFLPAKGVGKGTGPKPRTAPYKTARLQSGGTASSSYRAPADRVTRPLVPNFSGSGPAAVKRLPQYLLKRMDELVASAADAVFTFEVATNGHQAALAGRTLRGENSGWGATLFNTATPLGDVIVAASPAHMPRRVSAPGAKTNRTGGGRDRNRGRFATDSQSTRTPASILTRGLDDHITYYHATSVDSAANIRMGIDLSRGRLDLDFGRGFYTTTSLSQAQEWATLRFARAPEIVTFRLAVRDLNSLTRMTFEEANATWAAFVRHHRSGGAMHDFDMVEGPYIANPAQFRRGSVPIARGQQTSWHTQRAVELLMNGMVR